MLDERGVITAHGPFTGLDRFEARPAVTAALRELGPDRRREAAVRSLRRPLLAVRHGGRAAAVAAMVRQGRVVGEGGRRRGARRSGDDPSAGDGAQLLRLGRQHARLVHLAPAVVGSPDPGLVRAGRRGGCVGPDESRRAGRRLAAGRGRARHLVLFGAVAVLDPGLAGRHGRPREFYPTSVLLDRLRHHLLLGRADDDVRPVRDGRPWPGTSVPFRTVALHGLVRDVRAAR